MRAIRLNFLPFLHQDFSVPVYRREAQPGNFNEEYSYYDFRDSNGVNKKYELSNVKTDDFEEYLVPTYIYHDIVTKRVYEWLTEAASSLEGYFLRRPNDKRNKRIHFKIEKHAKGDKCVWIEPYYLKNKQTWGVLVGFQFVVNDNGEHAKNYILDRDILIASGSLNSKGQSNLDFYLFKHEYIKRFVSHVLPEVNLKFSPNLQAELFELPSYQLKLKQYFFKDGYTSSSSFQGLSKSGPLGSIVGDQIYDFMYLEEDRNYAVSLLKGLRGETHPNIFSGVEALFKTPFSNSQIKGTPLKDLSEQSIDAKIAEIKQSGKNVLPIIIINAKRTIANEREYYFIKNKLTNAGIPCQIVTKDLIRNENSLKFSLANIALQIFAKSGGKPWKMKAPGNEYLIIGIGQSYNIEKTAEGNSIEKNITYSVLTDSSGIFKDIQILSEGVESDDSYWSKLTSNIAGIINKSPNKRVVLHVPFRISKDKVLEKVASLINSDIELSVLVINDTNPYFGFDYLNNGLVPFEGTFVKLSKYEYLIWFEGIQPANPKITKRYGNPLLVKFWFTNKPELFEDYNYREVLLQDCINLSGANWRGFKSKQLPVSIFYCQRIAEFISKFREYHLEHVEINNLKPWFL
jgi:hypothetical protein